MRILTFLAALFLAFASAGPLQANPSIVVDVATGKVLEHEQAFDRWYPASITKIMTTTLAFEAVRSGELSMRSPVKVTKRALAEPPSKMGYPVGTELTLENALKIMMVKSANDIATAIGEAVGGTRDRFIEMMNERAAELGMTDTRFANPHGLPEPGQYTTARDFGLLAAHVRREFPEYAGIFSIEALELPGRGAPVKNTNILLGRMAGVDGMKTGYICASGFNLVASATREGRTVVAVVLGALDSQTRAEKAADLLAAGFAADPSSAPHTLRSLPRYGDAGGEVADITAQICTGQAQLARYDERDVDGKMIYRSPNMEPMQRDPVAISVSLGGADGPPARNTGMVDIPVAQPRPASLRDLATETASANAMPAVESTVAEAVEEDEAETAVSTEERASADADESVEAVPLPEERPAPTQ